MNYQIKAIPAVVHDQQGRQIPKGWAYRAVNYEGQTLSNTLIRAERHPFAIWSPELGVTLFSAMGTGRMPVSFPEAWKLIARGEPVAAYIETYEYHARGLTQQGRRRKVKVSAEAPGWPIPWKHYWMAANKRSEVYTSFETMAQAEAYAFCNDMRVYPIVQCEDILEAKRFLGVIENP